MEAGVGRTCSVSVDRIDESGNGVHELDDGNGELALGPLPKSSVGDEVLVEIWDQDQARVVDPRFQLSTGPSYSPSNTDVHARLKTGGARLTQGNHMWGIVENLVSDDEGEIISGGYRIRVPDVQLDEVALVRITEARRQKFGPNRAEGVRIDDPSIFKASIEADLGLKCLKGNRRWSVPDVGDLDLHILSQTVRRTRAGQSISIFDPGFNLHLPLRTAIELVYDRKIGERIALYTPGTSVHWGDKGEVREVYRRHGLSTEKGETKDAVPLDEVFAHGYTHDGELRFKSEGVLDGQLVLIKRLEELGAIPDLAAIVVDWTSKKGPHDDDLLEQVAGAHPEIPIVTLSSPYTKNERDGAPRYAPTDPLDGFDILPTEEHLAEVKADYNPQVGRGRIGQTPDRYLPGHDGGSPLTPTTTDVLGMLRDRPIKIEPVDSGPIGHLLDQAIDRYEDLMDGDLGLAANKVFSAEMYFERLPVPTEQHDEWVRDRFAEGDRYLPELTRSVVENLEEFGGQIEDIQAPAAVFGAAKALARVETELRQCSPMYDRILEEVQSTVEDGSRIGIFCPRKSWVGVLRESLIEEGIPEETINRNILLLDPDSIRNIPPCQRLLFTGPQRPQYAGFYLHPRARETIILSYDGGWAGMIERQAEDYHNRLYTSLPAVDEDFYPRPSIELTRTRETGDIDDSSPRMRSNSPFNPEKSEGQSNSGRDQEETVPSYLGEDSIVQEMDARERERLMDLVNLAPTKNRELAAKWNLDSGSEVYQYLSSHLNEFYTRNEDQLIIPTDRARRSADEIEDHSSERADDGDM